MRISTKGDYATRALQELSMHYNKGLLQIDEIAERQDIPGGIPREQARGQRGVLPCQTSSSDYLGGDHPAHGRSPCPDLLRRSFIA
jgi:hypothetical protein